VLVSSASPFRIGELTNSATYFAEPCYCQYYSKFMREETSPFSDSLWVFVFDFSFSADMIALFSPRYSFCEVGLMFKMLMFCLVGGGIVGSANAVASLRGPQLFLRDEKREQALEKEPIRKCRNVYQTSFGFLARYDLNMLPNSSKDRIHRTKL